MTEDVGRGTEGETRGDERRRDTDATTDEGECGWELGNLGRGKRGARVPPACRGTIAPGTVSVLGKVPGTGKEAHWSTAGL